MYTSGTTGYMPNQSIISTFEDYHKVYTNLGNPHPDDTTYTSYCSQITEVIKIPGKKDLYVALADRWMPQACGTEAPKIELKMIGDSYKGHKPKERNFEKVSLMDRTHEKRTEWDVTYNATYVWLPITWENGVPNIYWKDEWKLEDYD